MGWGGGEFISPLGNAEKEFFLNSPAISDNYQIYQISFRRGKGERAREREREMIDLRVKRYTYPFHSHAVSSIYTFIYSLHMYVWYDSLTQIRIPPMEREEEKKNMRLTETMRSGVAVTSALRRTVKQKYNVKLQHNGASGAIGVRGIIRA